MLQLARAGDRASVDRLACQLHGLRTQWVCDICSDVEELWSQSRFDDAVKQRQLFCASIGDEIVGYVLVRISDRDMPGYRKSRILYIDELCVEETLRNRGIGTEMIMEVRAIAKAFGCTGIQFGVYPQNNEALAFFHKCGFRISKVDMQAKV